MIARVISVAALVVAGIISVTTGGGRVTTLARFTSSASVGGNSFAAAPDWTPPAVTAFAASLESDTRTGGVIRRGSTFRLYANVDDSGSPASGVASVVADAHLLVNGATAVELLPGSYTFPSGGTTYAYRSAVLTADAALARGSYAVTVRPTDRAGNVGTVALDVPVSTTYVLRGAANHITGSCPAATGGQRDMELGHVPAGPEQSRTGPGPRDVVTFCSDSFNAGASIPSGTTEVSLTFQNTLAKACNVTTTLWRGSVSLGSVTRSIPANTTRSTGSWTFATTGTTFASGDRLSLTVEYQAGNVCNGATFWWDSATAPSKVIVP